MWILMLVSYFTLCTFVLFCYIIRAAHCRTSQYASVLFGVPWMEKGMKWRADIREQLISGVVCVREMEVKWRIAGSDRVCVRLGLIRHCCNTTAETKPALCVCVHEIKALWIDHSIMFAFHLLWLYRYNWVVFLCLFPCLVFVCLSRLRGAVLIMPGANLLATVS